jgi:hypothetical protein
MRESGTLGNNPDFALSPILTSAPANDGSAPKNCAAKKAADKKMSHGDDTNGPNGGETPDSAAHYIAAIAGELAKIARRNGLETLSTILEMAQLEADQSARQ